MKYRTRNSLLVGDREHRALKKLYGSRAMTKENEFAAKKLKRIVLAGCLLITFILIMAAYEARNEELTNGYYIARNEYGQGSKRISIKVETEDEELLTGIEIPERKYTSDEIEEMLPEFRRELLEIVRGKNDSIDRVSSNLSLVDHIEPYPFAVGWQSYKPLILSNSGEINFEKLKETEGYEKGICIQLTANISYEDYLEEQEMTVCVMMPEDDSEESFEEKLAAGIEEMNEITREKEYMVLPQTIAGEKIRYSESNADKYIAIVLLSVVIVLLAARQSNEEIHVALKKREEECKHCYPRLVNRFVLYFGAGMSIKNIWHKICEDYVSGNKKIRDKYVYEQMLVSDRQMMDGVLEQDAYERFAETIGMTQYKAFIGLLEQSLATGNSQVGMLLVRQAEEAFEMQKREARVLGEKAGTKLLIPMFMMLITVLIIILVPAMLSF